MHSHGRIVLRRRVHHRWHVLRRVGSRRPSRHRLRGRHESTGHTSWRGRHERRTASWGRVHHATAHVRTCARSVRRQHASLRDTANRRQRGEVMRAAMHGRRRASESSRWSCKTSGGRQHASSGGRSRLAVGSRPTGMHAHRGGRRHSIGRLRTSGGTSLRRSVLRMRGQRLLLLGRLPLHGRLLLLLLRRSLRLLRSASLRARHVRRWWGRDGGRSEHLERWRCSHCCGRRCRPS